MSDTDAIHSYQMEAKGPEKDSSCIASAQLCQLQYDPPLVGRMHPSYCNTKEFEAVPSGVCFFLPLITYKKYFILPKGKQIEERALSDNLDAG